MPFTTLEILRKHLISTGDPQFTVANIPVVLTGTDDVPLPHLDLLELSESVKWVSTHVPTLDGPITLNDEDPSGIADAQLVPTSAVVTLSESIETVYEKEKDYRLDYVSGAISRAPATAIPNHQPVYVYYLKYDVFERDTDYTIDYPTGIIRRKSGSSIPDGATVLLDYTVNEGSIEDTMLQQAILEANDIVVRALSNDYTASSTDQGLQTGTTQLSLSIFARSRAAETLAKHRASDSFQRSREWLNLAETWEKKAWEFLSPFLDPHMLRSPMVR